MELISELAKLDGTKLALIACVLMAGALLLPGVRRFLTDRLRAEPTPRDPSHTAFYRYVDKRTSQVIAPVEHGVRDLRKRVAAIENREEKRSAAAGELLREFGEMTAHVEHVREEVAGVRVALAEVLAAHGQTNGQLERVIGRLEAEGGR